MVQYIITPWRNRRELLSVRQALYPNTSSPETYESRKNAVALVSVWVQRGNCPHLIESTALLVSAVLNDKPENSTYAMRAAYSAAFCRFVTGLLDGYQDAKRKLSMYSIAKNIGLSASFVELRHQCTHEELPSLLKLRSAAEKSLAWIWEHYWTTLETEQKPASVDECRKIVKEYLRLRMDGQVQDQHVRDDFAKRVKGFEPGMVLEVLMESGDATDASFLLQSTRLASAILSGEKDEEPLESQEEPKQSSLDEIREEMRRAREALDAEAEAEADPDVTDEAVEDEPGGTGEDRGKGWEVWKGPWVPKPIGVV